MELSFITLDVFTGSAFVGNPVAIIHVGPNTALSQDQKQLIAREFNLSESVFLNDQTHEDAEAGNVRVDIFTTQAEIPFAGHPTIGTANYLLHVLKSGTAKALITKAGRIPIQASLIGDQSGSVQGASISVAHNFHIHNAPFKDTKFAHRPVVSIVKGMSFILAHMSNLEELGSQKYNLCGPENTYINDALDEGWRTGLIGSYFFVDQGVDESGTRLMRSRMFDSSEDPATGSAASALCCWLSLTEQVTEMRYRLNQGVEMGRSSTIFVQVTLSNDGKAIKDVRLSGSAVKVMRGQIEVP